MYSNGANVSISLSTFRNLDSKQNESESKAIHMNDGGTLYLRENDFGGVGATNLPLNAPYVRFVDAGTDPTIILPCERIGNPDYTTRVPKIKFDRTIKVSSGACANGDIEAGVEVYPTYVVPNDIDKLEMEIC